MDEIADLLFALASNDRLRLLLEIKAKELRLSQLAQKLSATIQETARHVSRLTEAKLVDRLSDGSYSLTSYGKQVADHLPSFAFLYRHKEYFLSHDLSPLPLAFTQRIGELFECGFTQHVADGMAYTDRLEREAEQYLWFMFDKCPDTSFKVGHPEKVSVRALGWEIRPELQEYCKDTFRERFEIGFNETVRVGMVINAGGAFVCFPDLKGRVDYSYGFAGSNPDFHRWCYDFYRFYWDGTKKSLPKNRHEL